MLENIPEPKPPPGRPRKPYVSVPLPDLLPLGFQPLIDLSFVPSVVLVGSTSVCIIVHSVSDGICQPVGQTPCTPLGLALLEGAPAITSPQVYSRPYLVQESMECP